MKRTALFAIVIAAVAGLSSCGSYNLRTIDLASFNPATGVGSVDLKGIGGVLQLQATGNYSNFTSKDLSQRVTYNVVITPGSVDAFGNALPVPPNGITVDATGLMTAVAPGVCTYVQTSTTPVAYALTGTYTITATFGSVTSNPVYIGMASAVSSTGSCGP